MSDSVAFEKALMAKLTRSDDREFLKKTSSAIAALKKQGLVIDDIYVKGKPGLDRVFIMGKPNPEFWRNFKNFADVPNLRRFEIFPYGIINPEGLNFRATFER